jgi:hypothetical protein
VTAPPQTPYRKYVARWRSYNERRWQFEKRAVPLNERAPFVCECTSGECLQAVELTMFELEAAHLCPNWTAVLPDHVMPDDATDVVLRYPNHWVVALSRLP